MPTPIQVLTDPLSLVIFGLYGAVLLYEKLWPARAMPSIPGWRVRAIGIFFLYFFLSSYLPLIWDEHLANYRLFDLSGWGPVAGTVVALFVYEACAYAYHRAVHASPVLWRTCHQLHHSAERLEALGAFYIGPLDTLGFSAVTSFALVLVVGVSPTAATAALLIITFLGIFQHANIHTPRWLGYFVQRPESHAVHHGRGHHRSNYSDLPVFDIVFGTFDNPETYEREAGFYDGASTRLAEMLLGQDVSEPPTGMVESDHA